MSDAMQPCLVASCARCLVTDGGRVCAQCTPPNVLLNGTCLPACPTTHTITSLNASLSRSCVPNLCAGPCRATSCFPTSTGCTTCRHGRYLLGGLCHNSCPAGWAPANAASWFHRRCVQPTAANCKYIFSNCHMCSANVCLECFHAALYSHT